MPCLRHATAGHRLAGRPIDGLGHWQDARALGHRSPTVRIRKRRRRITLAHGRGFSLPRAAAARYADRLQPGRAAYMEPRELVEVALRGGHGIGLIVRRQNASALPVRCPVVIRRQVA